MSFVNRIGQAVVTPGRAFAGADDATGGSPDAALLLVLKLVCTQIGALITSVWALFAVGPAYGLPPMLHRITEVIGIDLIALVAGGLLITVLAGRKRSVSRDFDLAAVAWVPFFAVTMVHILIITLVGNRLPQWLTWTINGVAFAWMLAWIGLAIRHARNREETTQDGAES